MKIETAVIHHSLMFEFLPTLTAAHPIKGVWIVNIGFGNYTLDIQLTTNGCK